MDFTDDELKAPMVLKYSAPVADHLYIEFHGRITVEAMQRLQLNPIDRRMIGEPVESAADLLQNLEIIFRRYQEQFPIDKHE